MLALEACRSLKTSATSWRRSRLLAAAAASPSCRRSSTPRARGICAACSRRAPRPRELGGRPARVRPPARPGRALGDPHLSAARVRPGDEIPAARRGRRPRARACCAKRGSSPHGRAARASAEARRRALVLPRRVSPRRAARRRLALGPARPAPRSARERARRRTLHRRGRCERRRDSPSRSDGRMPSPTRRDTRRSPTCWRSPERGTRRCARGARRAGRDPRRANRLVNADEANLVRAARAAHVQLEAIRSLDLDTLPAELAEIAELRLRHPSASLRELAAKARPPLSKAAAHRRLQAVVKLVENWLPVLQLL